MAYTTFEAVEQYLGDIKRTATEAEAQIEAFIPQISTYIDNHTHRTFEAVTATKYFDAEADVQDFERDGDKRMLWLGKHEIAEITTVTNGDSVVVASNQYVTEPRNNTPYYALVLKVSADVAWTWDSSPENAIAIAGKWGYSLAAPDDVQYAALLLAVYAYKRGDNPGGDADRAQVSPTGALMLPARMPKDVAEILAPYKRLL